MNDDLEARYRRARNTWLWFLISYIPICMGTGFVSLKLLGTATPAFVLAGIWGAAYLSFGLWAGILHRRMKRQAGDKN